MFYRQIQCFLETAKCLNFTTAAHNLYITQQAMTKQISNLEKELGLKLFQRTTHSVALTPAGQMLRDDFRDINRQIEESIKRVKSMGDKTLSITVGFFSALSRDHYIVPIANMLFDTFPDVYFDIKLFSFVELRNQLLDNKIDLVITTTNDWTLWPGVFVKVLESRPFEIVFSSRFPLAREMPFSLDKLKDYVELTLPKDISLPGVRHWGRKIPYSRVIQSPDIQTLMVRLANGQGFGLLTRVFDGFDSPILRYQEIPFPEAHAEIVCISRQDASEQTLSVANEISRFWQRSKAQNASL